MLDYRPKIFAVGVVVEFRNVVEIHKLLKREIINASCHRCKGYAGYGSVERECCRVALGDNRIRIRLEDIFNLPPLRLNYCHIFLSILNPFDGATMKKCILSDKLDRLRYVNT